MRPISAWAGLETSTTSMMLKYICELGYGRIACILVASYYILSNPVLAAILYYTSVILDEFDGRAARRLKQGWSSYMVFNHLVCFKQMNLMNKLSQ